MQFEIIEGDLLAMANEGKFDVIAHGCNCKCAMGSGIAGQISKVFPEAVRADNLTVTGDYNKMGNYTYTPIKSKAGNVFYLVNLYTQYNPGSPSPGCYIPLDYEALTMGLRKINRRFPKMRVGLPWIGCGLAKGDKEKVEKIIKRELDNVDVTIVEYKEPS